MFKNIIMKQTTQCDCGRTFIIQDIQKLERINDTSFYSGAVKHYSKAVCPKCGKEVILFLKQAGQTYEVINVAEESKPITKQVVKNVINDVLDEIITSTGKKVKDLEGKKEENTQNEATINTAETSNISNELICPYCEKELKNKSGLTNHLKTHQK